MRALIDDEVSRSLHQSPLTTAFKSVYRDRAQAHARRERANTSGPRARTSHFAQDEAVGGGNTLPKEAC